MVLLLSLAGTCLAALSPQPARLSGVPVRVLLYEGTEPQSIGLPQGGTVGELKVTPHLLTVTGGTQVTVVAEDGRELASGSELTVRCDGQQIFLWNGHPYRGEVVLAHRGEQLLVIDRLDLEQYLDGAVARELNVKEPEAEKAQAIVSRTYALAHLHPTHLWDFAGDVRAQAYAGVVAETVRTTTAVDETAGEVVSYNGRLARYVCFHSACGGQTASNHDVFGTPAVPYLCSVRCAPSSTVGLPGSQTDVDGTFCHDSPHFCWTVTWTRAQLEASLRDLLKTTGDLEVVRVVQLSPEGRATELEVRFNGKLYTFRGNAIRHALRWTDEQGRYHDLYSTAFELQDDGSQISATGHGWGHGVGMCQWGAVGMARQGATAEQILTHYFPGTQVTQLRQVCPLPTSQL
ncbi:MAG: SpoIID/LytB domain-containing protein [Candidatus Xenobia bacterium]